MTVVVFRPWQHVNNGNGLKNVCNLLSANVVHTRHRL